MLIMYIIDVLIISISIVIHNSLQTYLIMRVSLINPKLKFNKINLYFKSNLSLTLHNALARWIL